jgi:hypothetical protein
MKRGRWSVVAAARRAAGRSVRRTSGSGRCEPAECGNFGGSELTPLALVKIAKFDGTDRGPDKSPDLEPRREEQTPDLAVAPLVEHNLESGSAAGRLAEVAHLDGEHRLPFDQESAAAHPFQILVIWEALDGHKVGLGDGSRVHQALRESGVVAEQEQPFGVPVEATNRKPVAVVGGQEIKNGVRATLLDPRNDDPARLVEGKEPRQVQIPPSGRNAVS